MRPSFLDNMSWAMAEVYGAVTDRILVNLARYFPYIKDADEIRGSFEYQARMLAQLEQVNRETADIIAQSLDGADAALRQALEAAIVDALKNEEPALRKAAEQGLLNGAGMLPAEVTPNQMQAFSLYYRQSADKLNLVNTVMLESTQAAYTATVADAAARIGRTQSILNASAGEVVTGVSSWNTAMHDAVAKMVQNGLTGFIDHAGRQWSPESYVAMDIRTTMFNTARAAVWERNEDYGNDLYQVSSHNGARPLCYPWQGKVISRNDLERDVVDLYGDTIHVYPQSATTYGQAAGLFGVNCKHYPMTFIPGFSALKGQPQDPGENAKAYEQSQTQRALERRLREEKRDLAVMKAQGASEDAIRAQRAKVSRASSAIDEFCDETGRARRRNREFTPVDAKWPKVEPDTMFPTETRNRMNAWFGGAAPVETAPEVLARDATNIFGEDIAFSPKMDDPKWDESKKVIRKLATEYNTKLKEVSPGAHQAAGEVQISGTIMQLSATDAGTAVHEFAHSISIENQTKFGLYDEGDFWKEIRSIRTAYRKSLRSAGDDPNLWVSNYEHSNKALDEFMAEAFTLGYMREKGMKVPDRYGNDTVFSARVLDAVKRHFGK